MYVCMYTLPIMCIYICYLLPIEFIHTDRYPISYVRYGNVPIRDSPGPSVDDPGMRSPGGESLMGALVYFHIGYLIPYNVYTYMYIRNYEVKSVHLVADTPGASNETRHLLLKVPCLETTGNI